MESKPSKGFYQEEPHNPSSALCTLFLFSVAMFTLPIASYFATIRLLDKYYNIPSSDSYIFAVIVAVVMVQLIIAAYIYKAFQEDKPEPPKQD